MRLLEYTKGFAYKGFKNRLDYRKNQAKRLIGKGISKDEEMVRRKRLVEFHKKHPEIAKSKFLTPEVELSLALADKNSSRNVSRAQKKLHKSIKDTGSKYTVGKYAKNAARVAAPIAIIPIPGTALVAGTVVGAGMGADKLKLRQLSKKSPDVAKSVKAYRAIKKSIKTDEKIINLEKKAAKAKTERQILKINDKIRKLKKRYGIKD